MKELKSLRRVAVCAALALPALMTQTVLKASDVQPAGYPYVVALQNMGKKLEAATNGKYRIRMFPGGVPGSEKEMIEQARIAALQTGVVDGAENNPPTFFASNQYTAGPKFHSQTTHLIIPALFVMSRITWDKMSKDEQALIMKLSRKALWGLMTMFIILGGILSGVFTATESTPWSPIPAT